jgi:hypothetical protein
MNRLARAAGLLGLLLVGRLWSDRARGRAGSVWAAPIITIAVLGLACGYARLWRPLLEEPLRVDWQPSVLVAVVQLAVALSSLLRPELDAGLVPVAVWLVSTSHLALALVRLRLAVRGGPRSTRGSSRRRGRC